MPALGVHNEGDTSTLFINYHWRRLISDALQTYADILIRQLPDDEVDDFRNNFNGLLEDLYTVENMDALPVGAIINYTSETPPVKYLYCNGQNVNRSDYPELWDAVPAIWHTTGGFPVVDQIDIPDMRDKFARGATNSLIIGATAGLDTHTLTIAELPIHTHALTNHQHNVNTLSTLAGNNSNSVVRGNAAPTAVNPTTNPITLPNVGNTGSGDAHNNVPRHTALTFMIKALP